jgi:tetratricopeptide (TPR) repeat protein
VDSGTALFGFFKFLPLLLYCLVLMQQPDSREKVLSGFPYVATVMTVLSTGLMYIPALSSYFAVSGRLSGFVQYPNTFALILLVAELLFIIRDRLRVLDYVCMVVLLFGIVYTGSRMVLVLAGVANVVVLLLNKNKKVRWITLGSILAGVLLVFIVCLATDNLAVLTRYLKISLDQSTFIGRLLYAQDVIPVILRNPFGLGYKGYYYIQQSIQTGVYAVQYIHNDFLQMLIDVGWIPTATFIVAVMMMFFNRQAPKEYKIILAVMLIHACFDFDLQYIAVFMLLLLFMTPKELKVVVLSKYRGIISTAFGLLIGICLYTGVVQGLIRFEQYNAARMLYSQSTQCDMHSLEESTNPIEMDQVADRILERNPYVSVAYSAKARSAYAVGDFAQVIKYKNQVFSVSPFAYAEYVEYAYMLITGIQLYKDIGDTQSATICKQELLALSEALSALENRLSKLGKLIKTQPTLSFPDDLETYISNLKNEG